MSHKLNKTDTSKYFMTCKFSFFVLFCILCTLYVFQVKTLQQFGYILFSVFLYNDLFRIYVSITCFLNSESLRTCPNHSDWISKSIQTCLLTRMTDSLKEPIKNNDSFAIGALLVPIINSWRKILVTRLFCILYWIFRTQWQREWSKYSRNPYYWKVLSQLSNGGASSSLKS